MSVKCYFYCVKRKNTTKRAHPILSNKDIIFYRGNKSIYVDFSASEISTDRSLILLEKIE